MMPPTMGGAPNMPEVSIAFDEEAIHISPGAESVVNARVIPAGVYTVRFALLAASQASLTEGASLDRAEVTTADDGRARVVLTAPSAPTTFLLRAQVGSASATTAISVEAGALTSLLVRPHYTGKRLISEWVASVHAGLRCEDLAEDAPDSALSIRAAPSAALHLTDIPATSPLAVRVHAGQLARGCTTVLLPPVGEETSVSVSIRDEPVDLSESTLNLVFGALGDSTLRGELDAAISSIQSGLGASATSDSSALLDGMRAALSSTVRRTFDAARSDAGWDTLLTSLPRGWSNRSHDAIERWARGAGRALFSNRAFEGQLHGDPSVEGPTFTLLRFAGLAEGAVDVSANGGTWSVDPEDTLAFSAALSWNRVPLVCTLADQSAQAETGLSDVPESLSALLDCPGIATELGAVSSSRVSALLALCNVDCLASLCDRALLNAWTRTCAAGSTPATTLELSSTGTVGVSDSGELQSYQGSWLGRLTAGTSVARSAGSVSGASPRVNP